MSDRAALFQPGDYPERHRRRPSVVEKALAAMVWQPMLWASGVDPRRLAQALKHSGNVASGPDLQKVRYELRRTALGNDAARHALALVAESAHAVLDTRPDPEQMAAAWLLIQGRCVELPSLTARPLAVAMAAAVAGIAGLAVHVIVTTGFLARRDADAMRALFDSFGLSVGVVHETSTPEERAAAYAADVVYAVHREIAQDYLRDRVRLQTQTMSLGLKTGMLTAGTLKSRGTLLRGLQFAIVDDADTILVDAAQSPVSISADSEHAQEARWLSEALDLAARLEEGAHYRIDGDGKVEITENGVRQLVEAARGMAGIWQGETRRKDIVKLALVAQRVLAKDADYAVSGENLQIAEEVLRRHAPDPSLLRLLRLLVELKEKCRLTATRETLARIAFPRFFRGYLHMGALVSDLPGLGAELWSVHRLRPARIGSAAPGLQVHLPDRVLPDRERLSAEILARVKALQARAAPVLLVTRNHQACSAWAKTLKESGIECVGLMGTQDDKEAAAFAAGAAAGAVTVAVHSAARGVCAASSPDSDKAGGLRIIHVQLLPTPRHERALASRAIPAGATGSIQRVVALDDDGIAGYAPAWWRHPRLPLLRRAMLRYCQWRIARDQAHTRGEQLRVEDMLGDLLAFSGRGE